MEMSQSNTSNKRQSHPWAITVFIPQFFNTEMGDEGSNYQVCAMAFVCLCVCAWCVCVCVCVCVSVRGWKAGFGVMKCSKNLGSC